MFANVSDDMKIAKEEIFGPVMNILRFKDIDEVIRRGNQTFYGLAAVWRATSPRPIAWLTACGRAPSGSIKRDVFDAAAPFGGFKMSGIGRELAEYALQNYTEVKTVTVQM